MFLGLPVPDPDPLVRGMDPDPDPTMRLLQKSEYTTLSRPQQHSHSREKVLVNSLLQDKTNRACFLNL